MEVEAHAEFKASSEDSAQIQVGWFRDEDGDVHYVQFDCDRPSPLKINSRPYTEPCKYIRFFPGERDRVVTPPGLRRYLTELTPHGPHRANILRVLFMITCETMAHLRFPGMRTGESTPNHCDRRSSAYESSSSDLEARVRHIEEFLESRWIG